VSCNYYQFTVGYQASCGAGAGVYTAGAAAHNAAGTVTPTPPGDLEGYAASATDVSETAFTVGAAGQISVSSSFNDLWLIDQNKVLVNTTSVL
jgi:hypothetical protein